MDEQTLSAQDVEAALEAYRWLGTQRRMLEKADPILKVVQNAKNYVEAAQREAVQAHEDRESAKREAAETRAGATAEAARVVGEAKVAAERARQELTLVAADTDRLTGELNELTVQKARLVEDVKRLTAAVTALEASR